jgi:hypothetical protein
MGKLGRGMTEPERGNPHDAAPGREIKGWHDSWPSS